MTECNHHRLRFGLNFPNAFMCMLALPSFMEQASMLLELQHENELRVTMLNVESMNTIN